MAVIVHLTLSWEISPASLCGLAATDTEGCGFSGNAAAEFGPAGGSPAAAAAAATTTSLMVTVEEQTEEASSASPGAAEWKLWPELLKPLTLSPDDSELSTVTTWTG